MSTGAVVLLAAGEVSKTVVVRGGPMSGSESGLIEYLPYLGLAELGL